MTDERRPESSDLDDYEVQDPNDSLSADPGYDPFDRGVAPPERWTAGIRYGTTAEEQAEGESLDQLLAEEEPDNFDEDDEDLDDDEGGDDLEDDEDDDDLEDDEGAGDEDVDGLLLDDGPDPRAGRLVAEDEGAHPVEEEDLVARDAGFAGGAASAEEAAVHVVEEDDYDIRSE
jgi:Family of unknown function (DUF5709)